MAVWQPLVGPRLKLERAAIHIREFEALSETYLADEPYTICVEYDLDHRPSVKVVFLRPIPPMASAIVGDVVHNLRSALDHLAADMIRTSSKMPTKKTRFPIHKDKAGFEGGVTQDLMGAEPKFVDFIMNLKPFGNTPESRPFYDIARMNNDDKHLLLIDGTPALSIAKMVIYSDAGVFPIKNVAMIDGKKSSLPGTIIHRIEIEGHPRLLMHLIPGDFESITPVVPTLKAMHSCVEATVNGVAPLFV